MPRLAVIGDLHLGKTLYGYDLTPHARRAMYSFLDLCVASRVDIAVCLGDIYDRPAPPTPVRKMVSQWVNEFQRAGIDLYLLSGNHDATTSPDAPTALESLRVLIVPSLVHVVDRPTLLDCGALLLPFPSPGIYATRDEYDKDVQRVMRQGTTTLVLAHLTMDGASVGEQDFPYHGSDHGLPACLSQEMVLIGHVHKPQTVSPIRHVVGSADRTSFAERNEERGFVLLSMVPDSQGLSTWARKVVLRPDALELVQIEPDVSLWGTGGHPPTTEEIIADHADKVRGALVKVTPIIDDRASVDWSRVEAGLIEAGALRVFMGPATRAQSAKAKRKTGLVSADPEVAATRYIRQRVSDKIERKRVLEVFKRLQKEVEHGTGVRG